jgi:hypothetical protein
MMTLSKLLRRAGLESLAELSEISGVPVRTLQDWHKSKPKLIKVVLIGCKSIKDLEQ